MEEDILNFSQTAMFRWTPCIIQCGTLNMIYNINMTKQSELDKKSKIYATLFVRLFNLIVQLVLISCTSNI